MENFLIKNKASIWIIFLVWGLTAVMVMPGLTSVIVLFINLGLLFVLRWVAQWEGRHEE